MALSNKFGAMVVTTGNKSEMSVGYATLYGDMNGGFNPIKDFFKTQISGARYRNSAKTLKLFSCRLDLPNRQAHRAAARGGPSKVLRFAAAIRDARRAFSTFTSSKISAGEEIITARLRRGGGPAVNDVINKVTFFSEYKRRQAAPGLKVTLRNFGRDRRYPITNRFRDPGTPLPEPDDTLLAGKPVASEAYDF